MEAGRLADFRPLLWFEPGVAANTIGMAGALVIRVWPAAAAGCVAAPAQKATAAAVTATDHFVSFRDAVIWVRLPCLSGFSACRVCSAQTCSYDAGHGSRRRIP